MSTEKSDFRVWYALSVAAQLGFLIILPIIGFIFLGLWIDHFFASAPVFLLTGIILGLVVTVYDTYHFIKPLVSK